MNDHAPACAVELRRATLFAQRERFNGVDFVEVLPDQRSLCVHFFGDVPDGLTPANVRIEGGERIAPLHVLAVRKERAGKEGADDCLHVTLDRQGDFSSYEVCLVGVENIDTRYTCAGFRFRLDCPRELDCKSEAGCAPPATPAPDLNYLVKDYSTFRQLMLDRLALIMPDWQERHAPDLGMTLVELLAYAADHLSYYQDAVATEAYLDTARQRISVRRHVRLVDYAMHEGLNARAWVSVAVSADAPAIDPADLYFITGFADIQSYAGHLVDPADLRGVPSSRYEVFEPVRAAQAAPLRWRAAHNEIVFYTWGDADCCLAAGTTQATLVDDCRKLALQAGDVLVFEEVLGPRTGSAADADPAHRHAVRLTRAEPVVDRLFDERELLAIEWSAADALPFALCLSARLASPDCRRIEPVSIARGNVLLVDHGRSVADDSTVVDSTLEAGDCACEGSLVELRRLPRALKMALAQAPLAFADPADGHAAASTALMRDERSAQPQVWLEASAAADDLVSPPQASWFARADLLGSGPEDRHFVAEVDDDGRAHLRFGDGVHGQLPPAGMAFVPRYRIGGGRAGNVGRGSIAYMVLRKERWNGLTVFPANPMPARGGIAAETSDEARLRAPHAFRSRIERAITPEDYASIAARHPAVARAAARLRWTGSWYEARVAIDPRGTDRPDPGLLREVEAMLYPYRRIGHDLAVVVASYVPLDIALHVCVAPHATTGAVRAELLRVFGSAPGGMFHPDRLDFGVPVTVSQLVAAAQAVDGVCSARVTRLQRLFEESAGEIDNGLLPIADTEIAQLDNDPNFPERGILTMTTGGGR